MRLSFIEFFLLCLLVCFVSLQTTHACHLPNATRTYANNVPTQKRLFANEFQNQAAQTLRAGAAVRKLCADCNLSFAFVRVCFIFTPQNFYG
jgi:hypothetical protein